MEKAGQPPRLPADMPAAYSGSWKNQLAHSTTQTPAIEVGLIFDGYTIRPGQ